MLRLGIVGCGRILPAHLDGLKTLREKGVDIQITALVARKLEDAAMFRKRGEGPAPRPPVFPDTSDPLGMPHLYVSDFQDEVLPEIFDDHRKMLERDLVDAVIILTTVATHHTIGVDCLKAGKHILVEKPLAVSMKAGHLMLDEATKRGLVFSVAEPVGYRANDRAARWVMQNELIGKPQMVFTGNIGGYWSPDKIVAETPWRHQKLDAGGGVIIDLGPHRFHYLRILLGELDEIGGMAATIEPQRVQRDAEGNVIRSVENNADDLGTSNMRFKNGASGSMFFCWAGHGAASGMPMAVYGTKGSMIGGEVTLDNGDKFKVVDRFEQELSPEQKEKFFPFGMTNGFALEQYDWIRAITTGSPSETSGEEGLRDLAASFAILESSLKGCTVKVDDVYSGKIDEYQRPINEHYGLE